MFSYLMCFGENLALKQKKNGVNPAVLKLGVATLFRVAKCSLRVAKVYQDCPITLDS